MNRKIIIFLLKLFAIKNLVAKADMPYYMILFFMQITLLLLTATIIDKIHSISTITYLHYVNILLLTTLIIYVSLIILTLILNYLKYLVVKNLLTRI